VITSHCEGAIVVADHLLAWHRELIAHRYDGFPKPPDATANEFEALVALVAEYLGWG